MDLLKIITVVFCTTIKINKSKTEKKSINEKLANDYKEFIANLNFDTATSYIINKRSKYAANIAKAAISKKISEKRVRRSLAADKVILNKWAGIPIFLVVMANGLFNYL